MTLARLYGRTLGNGSLAVVTRGFESALRDAGILKGLYSIDLAASYVDGEAPTGGADARYGIYVGPLDAVGQMFERGRHEEHFIMVTPNSDQLPRDLVTKLNRYADEHVVTFIAPSRWATKVVQRHLGSCWPVPHGVSPEFRPYPEHAQEIRDLYAQGTFRVIHFSSSDRQRKGTVELLRAWEILQGSGWAGSGARLLCVMDYPAKRAIEEAIMDGEVENWEKLKETVDIKDRIDASPEGMARLLCQSHVVCQPSRGEGFGLVPLEALCSGVPVAATTVTGHSEFLLPTTRGFEPISTGELSSIDDLPGSLAPALSPMAIARALVRARDNWRELWMWAQNDSAALRANWSWTASLSREPYSFVEMLKHP